MVIEHRGHILSRQQQDAITPVLRESMRGRFGSCKVLLEAMDKALEEAGCPVPENSNNEDRANG